MQSSGLQHQWTQSRLGIRNCTCRPYRLRRKADRAWGSMDRRTTGLDHGVGHFRPLSITRQRHCLTCHFTAMRHEGLCQVSWQLLSLQPIEFQLLINSFYFNVLEEKEEKSNSCTNDTACFRSKKYLKRRQGDNGISHWIYCYFYR